jgi:hypothetical protein
MAVMALCGRGLEVDVPKGHLQVRRLMAIDARDGSMRADQRKRSCGMVKSKIRSPGLS